MTACQSSEMHENGNLRHIHVSKYFGLILICALKFDASNWDGCNEVEFDEKKNREIKNDFRF